MAKKGQIDSTFDAPLGKTPGNVGVSGEVGGKPLTDKDEAISGGAAPISSPFDATFPLKKG